MYTCLIVFWSNHAWYKPPNKAETEVLVASMPIPNAGSSQSLAGMVANRVKSTRVPLFSHHSRHSFLSKISLTLFLCFKRILASKSLLLVQRTSRLPRLARRHPLLRRLAVRQTNPFPALFPFVVFIPSNKPKQTLHTTTN